MVAITILVVLASTTIFECVEYFLKKLLNRNLPLRNRNYFFSPMHIWVSRWVKRPGKRKCHHRKDTGYHSGKSLLNHLKSFGGILRRNLNRSISKFVANLDFFITSPRLIQSKSMQYSVMLQLQTNVRMKLKDFYRELTSRSRLEKMNQI